MRKQLPRSGFKVGQQAPAGPKLCELSLRAFVIGLPLLACLGVAHAQDSPTTNMIVQFGVTSGTVSERRLTIVIGLDVTFPTEGAWPTGTVEYATMDGTAKGGLDYVPVQGTYRYVPGENPIQPYVVLNLMEDPESEPDEYFFLTLRNPQDGAALGSKTNLMITIRDNDSPAGPGLGPDTSSLILGFCSDNKAFVTGLFRAVDGVARAGIARLNSDNTLDQSFELSSEVCTRFDAAAVQRDGKVLLAGCHTNLEAQHVDFQRLFRVTAEGRLDPSLNAYVMSACCSAQGAIRQIVPQPDGRVVISGFFTNVSGIGCAGIARLEQDGNVDPGFVVQPRPGYGKADLTLLPDGKYLVTQETEKIIRLNADGSDDATFELQTNGYCAVQPSVTAVQADGTFKPADELQSIYVQQKGVDAKKDTIAYCRIGERSSHTWFVLKYLLGLNNVKNYDGSWTEYGNVVAAPIEKSV